MRVPSGRSPRPEAARRFRAPPRIRPDHADELVREIGHSDNRIVNALCQAGRTVFVARARNDAGVRLLCVEAFVVPVVVCEHGPVVCRTIRQHLGVHAAFASRFLYRHNVMTEGSQEVHHRQRKVFVRIQAGHGDYGSLLSRICSSISPGWSR